MQDDYFSQFVVYELRMGECCTYIDDKDDKEYFVPHITYTGEGKTFKEANRQMMERVNRACVRTIAESAKKSSKKIKLGPYEWDAIKEANGGDDCVVVWLSQQTTAIVWNGKKVKEQEGLVCYKLTDNCGAMTIPRLDKPCCSWMELALFCPDPEIFTLIEFPNNG